MSFKYWAAFLSCLFFSFSFADILKDDLYVSGKNSYSLKEACKFFYKSDFPLVSKKSISKIDCMSKVLDAAQFCSKKEITNPYLVRAIVDSKAVECVSAKKVNIKYRCKKVDPLCKSAEFACNGLRQKLAIRFITEYSYMLNDGNSYREVVCHFLPKPVKKLL